jgi:2-oxoglutarate ferredoxin oxidoreductase subunit alpha
MSTTISEILGRKRETIDKAVIRFCGDSGDGMQITGSQFTNTAALYGNDLATFPDYPAEIRAPAGTLPGVSGFQVHFSSSNVYTPGDSVDVLIAMNPAALKMNLPDLKTNGILIVNSDDFKETDLRKAQITVSPLEDHSLDGYRLFAVELTKLTRAALKDVGLDAKSMDRCKNFFALGMCYWLYNRSMEPTLRWLDDKFKTKPQLVSANKLAMQAGYSFCEATEAFQISYEIPPAFRCSWVRIRSRRLPTFFTNCPCTRTSASPPFRPKTKSRPSPPPSAPHTPVRWPSPPLPVPAWR